MKKGFTLIELLLGLSMSAAIFIVATSLVVNVFTSTTKSKQVEDIEQVKNDLQAEFSNSVKWADSLSFVGGNFSLDEHKYYLDNGKLFRDGIVLTPDQVEITKFEVKKHSTETSSDTNVGMGLRGQYFNNEDFTGLSFIQTDFNVDYDWSSGSPDALIDHNTFSVRYSGQVMAPVNGQYTFSVFSDEGARLWVNNILLIDDWGTPGPSESSGIINLLGNTKYDVNLEYYENFGNAAVKLYWQYPGKTKEIVPTIYLFPKSGPLNIEISIDMKYKTNPSLMDSLELILSPRSGNISTFETL